MSEADDEARRDIVRGVLVRLDELVHGIDTCYATHDEPMRPADVPADTR